MFNLYFPDLFLQSARSRPQTFIRGFNQH